MSKLIKMLDAEISAEKAYAALSAAERQAYVNANPRSRFIERAEHPRRAAGGIIRMDDNLPEKTHQAMKNLGVEHHRDEGEGGSEYMSRMHWNPKNAHVLHRYVTKHWNPWSADGGPSDKENHAKFADRDAHDMIEGWTKLHKHVTGRDPDPGFGN